MAIYHKIFLSICLFLTVSFSHQAHAATVSALTNDAEPYVDFEPTIVLVTDFSRTIQAIVEEDTGPFQPSQIFDDIVDRTSVTIFTGIGSFSDVLPLASVFFGPDTVYALFLEEPGLRIFKAFQPSESDPIEVVPVPGALILILTALGGLHLLGRAPMQRISTVLYRKGSRQPLGNDPTIFLPT